MANKNRVAGQARVKVDGDLLDTDGTTSIELGGPKRESVTGDYQAGAFRQSEEPSKVEATILVKGGTSLASLRGIDNATVTLETDTGQTFIVRNAYVADVISFNTSEGKAKVVFQGPPAEEMA